MISHHEETAVWDLAGEGNIQIPKGWHIYVIFRKQDAVTGYISLGIQFHLVSAAANDPLYQDFVVVIKCGNISVTKLSCFDAEQYIAAGQGWGHGVAVDLQDRKP